VKVFLTGGTGFVGPAIAHAIRARGEEVRALVRERRRGEQLEHWGAELVEGDVTDPESVRRGLEGVDVVVHLIAIRQGKSEQFELVMGNATRDLVAAAKEEGVRRFVLMSALGTTEETKDLVPYYREKWKMEQAVKDAGIERVIFRPSFVFGREGGILPTFKKLARLSPVTAIVGPGHQRIQPIWIDDVADYFAAAIDKTEAANRTFEHGHVERVLGAAAPRARDPAAPDRPRPGRLHATERPRDGAAPRQHPAHS
jgi:uncharacterized protein YbjT (DUF2867 family)